MSELRYDPLKRRWVILAPERRRRPHEFLVPLGETPEQDITTCPFEYGREALTDPEIMSIPRSTPPTSGPNWQVRVVPSRFPALRVEEELNRDGSWIYDRVSGVGAHELVVESPEHSLEMADMRREDLVAVFTAYRARLRDLRRDDRLRHVLIFKNRGVEAGAVFSHPHSLLLATPVIPISVVNELQASREHFQNKERCLFCDLVRHEHQIGERIAIETEDFVALEPYASAHPFETWLLPKTHSHDFATASDQDLTGLAAIVRDLLRRFRVLLNDPPFNLVLHTAPTPLPRPGHPQYWSTLEHDFHWHVEIVPRLTRVAGFEWGTGYTINPTPPEEAARYLRDTDPEGERRSQTDRQ